MGYVVSYVTYGGTAVRTVDSELVPPRPVSVLFSSRVTYAYITRTAHVTHQIVTAQPTAVFWRYGTPAI